MSGIIPTDDLEALVGEALQRSGHEEHIASTLNRISGINHIGNPTSSSLGKRRFALLLDKSKNRSTAENCIGFAPAEKPVAKLVLRYDGKGKPFKQRSILVSNGNEVLVGRSNDANAKVQDDNCIFECRVLSRKHANLWYEKGNGFFVKDLMSSNGTFVNGSRIACGAARQISSGDLIQFGQDVCDGATNERHECILAKIDLFDPDQEDQGGLAKEKDLKEDDSTLSPMDAQELKKCLDEMSEREKEIEQKMAKVGIILDHVKSKVKDGWHAMITEDALLSKIETLESEKINVSMPHKREDVLTEKLEALAEKVEIVEQKTDFCMKLQKMTNCTIIYLSAFIVMLFIFFLLRDNLKVRPCLNVW